MLTKLDLCKCKYDMLQPQWINSQMLIQLFLEGKNWK